MPSNGNGPKGLPRPSARGNVTPPGHRNVRVFVPTSLHYRLVAQAAASETSLHDFVVSWLERATPLRPGSSPQAETSAASPDAGTPLPPATGHWPAQDGEGLSGGAGAAGPSRSPTRDGNEAGTEGVPIL